MFFKPSHNVTSVSLRVPPDISTCRTASSMAPRWEADTMETVFHSPLSRSCSSTSTLLGFHIYPSPCSMLRSG